MPKVTIVIPCYNLGAYVEETVRSVAEQTFQDYEMVLVDDGSTDPESCVVLDRLDHPRLRISRTENRGVSAARNHGIALGSGEYILPLDADDRIAADYLATAVAVLDARPGAGIVYGRTEFFGDMSGGWDLPPYSLEEILVHNLIPNAGIFRRGDWSATGGYDEQMRSGWEDYDFWLTLIERGVEVVQLPRVTFYYRRYPTSMSHTMTEEGRIALHGRLFRKHRGLYEPHVEALFRQLAKIPEAAAEVRGCHERNALLIQELHRTEKYYQMTLQALQAQLPRERLRRLVRRFFPRTQGS